MISHCYAFVYHFLVPSEMMLMETLLGIGISENTYDSLSGKWSVYELIHGAW